jgi:hypothetical protein
MIATTTDGIAHGTSASERASQRPRSGWLSSRARPSARQKPIAVTDAAQIAPILNELTKSESCSAVWKFARPTQCVGTPRPARESVKPR